MGRDKRQYMTDLFDRMKARNHWEKLVTYEIVTSPGHHYLYTAISKTACTQVNYILTDLLRYPEKFDRTLSPHNPENTGLVPVAGIQDGDEAYRLIFDKDVFRFTFVRNPLSRLLSAFTNKIQLNFYALWEHERLDRLENIYTNLAIRIKSGVTGLTESSVDLHRDPLTFREFVHFIAAQDPFEMDRHWYPQHRAMFHDIITYQFIGRIENFNDDIRHVLENIHAPADIYDFNERQNASPSKFSLNDYYDSELERLVVKKYEEDFDLFSYPKYQVRPFQSMHVAETEGKPLTYRRKLDSIDTSDTFRNIGVICQSDGNYVLTRERIRKIREQWGYSIRIYLGVHGIKDAIFDDLTGSYRVKVFYFEGLGFAETLNELIRKVDEPYFLNLPDHVSMPHAGRLRTAYKILRANDQIKIVIGSGEYLPGHDDQAEGTIRVIDPSIILYDQDTGTLILVPVKYFNPEKYYADEWEYVFCDTVNELFLADRKIFPENALWFDERIKYPEHVLLDFCMKVMEHREIKIAASGCLNSEMQAPNIPKSDLSQMKAEADPDFFNKWHITRFQVTGNFIREVNKDSGVVYESPYRELNCLGQTKESYTDRSNEQKQETIASLDQEISRLQKELHTLKDSLSWKLTKLLRIVPEKFTGR